MFIEWVRGTGRVNNRNGNRGEICVQREDGGGRKSLKKKLGKLWGRVKARYDAYVSKWEKRKWLWKTEVKSGRKVDQNLMK